MGKVASREPDASAAGQQRSRFGPVSAEQPSMLSASVRNPRGLHVEVLIIQNLTCSLELTETTSLLETASPRR